MDIKALQALIETATKNYEAQKDENSKLETKFKALDEKHVELLGKFDKLQESGDKDVSAVKAKSEELVKQLEELESEMSDLRTKQRPAIAAISDEDQKKAMGQLGRKAVGEFVKSYKDGNNGDFFTFIKANVETQCKALNITNPSEGGLAVAEILSRDVMEYAREFSPIINHVGMKSAITRDYRQLIKVTYPSVQEGIENVAGSTIAETTTQTYVEVKSNVFKLNAKPRITDEAMYGSDIDIYADLRESLGEEIGIYLAAQLLFGNGTGKNARGILSSNRVDITDLTGESFKPTLGAGRRDSDFYPVKTTGVSGSIGTDDVAIVDFVIDTCNELPTRYLNGAMWYMNRKTKGLFEKVRDADDKPIFMYDYVEGLPGKRLVLNGYPVVIDDTMPDVAADSLFAIFGRLDMAFAINNGDIDKLLVDPYSSDGCTVIKMDKEFFEMVQRSNAILVCAATANGPA